MEIRTQQSNTSNEQTTVEHPPPSTTAAYDTAATLLIINLLQFTCASLQAYTCDSHAYPISNPSITEVKLEPPSKPLDRPRATQSGVSRSPLIWSLNRPACRDRPRPGSFAATCVPGRLPLDWKTDLPLIPLRGDCVENGLANPGRLLGLALFLLGLLALGGSALDRVRTRLADSARKGELA